MEANELRSGIKQRRVMVAGRNIGRYVNQAASRFESGMRYFFISLEARVTVSLILWNKVITTYLITIDLHGCAR